MGQRDALGKVGGSGIRTASSKKMLYSARQDVREGVLSAGGARIENAAFESKPEVHHNRT